MMRNTLPNYTTPFVGRSKELLEIKNRLQNKDCHILSLVGSGGIGKTRLAVHYATDQASDFEHEVTFVSLQSASDEEHMVILLAEALEFKFYEYEDATQQVQDFLRDKNLLLVMDNYESLLPEVEFVSSLIHSSPNLKILVTSREPLNIQEEWLYSVTGMKFADVPSKTADNYDAIQLFASRAQQIRQDFSLERELPYIARICRLVEGMPLAIELAVTWLRTLSCKEIGDQIEHNLDFLVSSMRNVPSRHQSIRTVFNQSWSMLSNQEQDTFMKLAIFNSGFNLDAAKSIASANVLILSGLVEKSFLRRTDSDRYQIHELMRQYGLEKLETSTLYAQTQGLHCEYFLQLLARNTDNLMGKSQTSALDEIEAEYANIRFAWEFAVAQGNYKGIVNSVDSFYWFCVFRGYFQEGIKLLELTIAGSVPPSFWSKVKAKQIGLMVHAIIEDRSDWHFDLEQCLKIARNDQDLENIGFCLSIMGLRELVLENFAQSRTYYEQSLEAYQQFGNDFYIARVLRQIGYVYLHQGNFEGAEPRLRDSLALARHCGDKVTEANCLYNLGSVAGFRNDIEDWFSAYEAALRIRRELDDRASIALNLGGLAIGFFCRGDLDRANKYASEALSIATDINHRESKGLALIWLAYIACINEHYEESQILFERSIHLVPENNKSSWVLLGQALLACGENDYNLVHRLLRSVLMKMPLLGGFYVPITVTIWAFILIAEDELEQGIYIISNVLNHPSKIANFIEKWNWFVHLKQRLEKDLGETRFSDAWEHGKTLVLEEIIVELKAEFLSVESAHQGESITKTLMAANNSLDEPLTDREHEILILIARGLSNQEIADQLYIAKSTVKRHINHCYGKLGVSSRTKAIVEAQKLKLINSTPPVD